MLGFSPNALVLLVVAPFVAMFLLSFWRHRESIGRTLRMLFILEGTYLGVAFILVKLGQPPLVAILAGLFLAAFIRLRMPERKRYVRASDRRRAIARFELKTGQKYNSRKHEIDHEVPFSRGGGHTADNLRVVDKRVNRSKGNQTPWWDLLGKR